MAQSWTSVSGLPQPGGRREAALAATSEPADDVVLAVGLFDQIDHGVCDQCLGRVAHRVTSVAEVAAAVDSGVGDRGDPVRPRDAHVELGRFGVQESLQLGRGAVTGYRIGARV